MELRRLKDRKMDIFLRAKKLILSALGYTTTVETTATRVLFETDSGYYAFDKRVQGHDPVNSSDFVTKNFLENSSQGVLTCVVVEIDTTLLDEIYELLPQEPNTLFVATGLYIVCTDVDGYITNGEIFFPSSIGGGMTNNYSTVNFSSMAQIISIVDETYSGTYAYNLNGSNFYVKIKSATVATTHKAKIVLIGKKITY